MRLAESAKSACAGLVVLAACVVVWFTLSTVCQWTCPTPASSTDAWPISGDRLIVVDWDVGVVRYIPLNGLRPGELAPATRMRREDLAGLPIDDIEVMEPTDRRGPNCLLRDVATGQLHQPSGIWCWPQRDGVAGEMIGCLRVIDAVFDDAAEQASGLLDEKRDRGRLSRASAPTELSIPQPTRGNCLQFMGL